VLTYSPQNRDPTNWLSFTGHFGDKEYPQTDPIQNCLFGSDKLCMYANGPTGPIDKQLDREKVCPESDNLCIVWHKLVQ